MCVAHVLQILRLFISKHHLSVIAGEACLAPTKPCLRKATDVILLPLQGAYRMVRYLPKALPWARLCCTFSAKNKLPPFVIRHLYS